MPDINDFELYQELQQKIKAEKNKILFQGSHLNNY
jgi:hypothetical protein